MNKKSLTRCSVDFTNFKKKNIDEYFNESNDNNDLLVYYLKNIRNYKALNDEMLNNISSFDEESKMKIIRTYNNIIETLQQTISLDEKK
jgi:hypothetical protein